MRPLSTMKHRRRLVVAMDGLPFTGKTHFMLTMPQPSCIFSIDRGLEGMVEEMESRGYNFKGVEFEDYSLKKPPLGSSAMHTFAERVIKRFHRNYRRVLERVDPHGIGMDTGSEFWQLFRLADLGQLEKVPPMRYTKVNRMWRDLMNEIYNGPHSLVIIHREKDRYDQKVTDEGKEVGVKVAGEVDRDGFKEMDGVVQVVLRGLRKEKKNGRVEMGFLVRKCRQRSSIVGKKYWGSMATFPNLAMDVFPNSDPSDWGV